MPVTCFVIAFPLGAFLAASEGWSFLDGWLFAASVLVQAPPLAPASAVAKTHGGRMLILIVAVYSLCITLGWGAGMIVASSALDMISKRIQKLLGSLHDAGSVTTSATPTALPETVAVEPQSAEEFDDSPTETALAEDVIES